MTADKPRTRRSQSRASVQVGDRLRVAFSDVEARLGGAPPPVAEARHGDDADRRVALGELEDVAVDRARLQARRGLILSALERLDRQVYGLCLECQHAIPAARLWALPEVERCVRCQDALERATPPATVPRPRSRATFPDDDE